MFSAILNIFPNKDLIDYGYSEQLKDLSPAFFLSIVMGVIVKLEEQFQMNDLLLILIQACTGVVVYIGLSAITHNDSYIYLLKFAKEKIGKRGNVK